MYTAYPSANFNISIHNIGRSELLANFPRIADVE